LLRRSALAAAAQRSSNDAGKQGCRGIMELGRGPGRLDWLSLVGKLRFRRLGAHGFLR